MADSDIIVSLHLVIPFISMETRTPIEISNLHKRNKLVCLVLANVATVLLCDVLHLGRLRHYTERRNVAVKVFQCQTR
jgi:hypothetical protein